MFWARADLGERRLVVSGMRISAERASLLSRPVGNSEGRGALPASRPPMIVNDRATPPAIVARATTKNPWGTGLTTT